MSAVQLNLLDCNALGVQTQLSSHGIKLHKNCTTLHHNSTVTHSPGMELHKDCTTHHYTSPRTTILYHTSTVTHSQHCSSATHWRETVQTYPHTSQHWLHRNSTEKAPNWRETTPQSTPVSVNACTWQCRST